MTSVGSQAYSCIYNDVTRRLSISTSGSRDFKILGAQRGSTASLQLGILKGQETGMSKDHIMENPLNLSASQPILLTSRTLQAGSGIVYVAGLESQMNVLACITPDAMNDVVQWVNPSDNMFSCGEVSLSSIDIQLVDSQSLQQIKFSAPIVAVIGFYDDVTDLY
ncbi:hypothetical protein DFS34DRAFT_675204 [Phlyctochytrium arcticum]|nr:hypothetical protein DFS34DRAFT_675204 [Phlyctochytrium arcticum]